MKLLVETFGNPEVDIREVLPSDTKKQIEDKQKYPFIAKEKSILKIAYIDKNNILFTTAFSNPRNYKYDGATIPFKIGKGNPKLLIPAMWHDLMCEHKEKINYNRHLSSLVFKELLLQCHINFIIAQIFYFLVDTFQKFRKGWKLGKYLNKK